MNKATGIVAAELKAAFLNEPAFPSGDQLVLKSLSLFQPRETLENSGERDWEHKLGIGWNRSGYTVVEL